MRSAPAATGALGALEALLIEALARAHGRPAAAVRRAVMPAGGITPVVGAW